MELNRNRCRKCQRRSVCESEGDNFRWCSIARIKLYWMKDVKKYIRSFFTFEYKMKCKCTHTSSDGSSERNGTHAKHYELFFRYFFSPLSLTCGTTQIVLISKTCATSMSNSRPTDSTRCKHHRCVNLIFFLSLFVLFNPQSHWNVFFHSHLALYETHHIYEFVLRRLLLQLLLILIRSTICEVIIIYYRNDSDFLWTTTMWTFWTIWAGGVTISILWILWTNSSEYFISIVHPKNSRESEKKTNGISQERRIHQVQSDRAEFLNSLSGNRRKWLYIGSHLIAESPRASHTESFMCCWAQFTQWPNFVANSFPFIFSSFFYFCFRFLFGVRNVYG